MISSSLIYWWLIALGKEYALRNEVMLINFFIKMNNDSKG